MGVAVSINGRHGPLIREGSLEQGVSVHCGIGVVLATDLFRETTFETEVVDRGRAEPGSGAGVTGVEVRTEEHAVVVRVVGYYCTCDATPNASRSTTRPES